tara:strand:+ start:271 stop:528 length:258 start_codon:yes stop_codon:yes gene_type:complete
MPARKKSVSTQDNKVNVAKLGRSYYDIVDVYNQKIISSFIENSEKLRLGQLNNEEFKRLVVKNITQESEMFKSWGWDVLSKNLND